jgi:DNA-binding beta-propeller fold protein YncE
MRSIDPRAFPGLVPIGLLLAASLGGCAHNKPKYDYVIPPPPEQARYKLEFVYSGSDDYDEGSKTADALLGKKSAGESHRLFKPFGVVSNGKGLVYVSDTAKPPRIEVFDDVKKEVRLIGMDGQGRLLLPLGLALDAGGDVYVADAKQRIVIRFDAAGNFKGSYGSKDTLERPTAVAIDDARKVLYVSDTGAHRVQVFGLEEGKLLRTLGKRGAEPGAFNFPEGLAVGKDGRLYVVDALNFRYELFDASGKFLAAHGQIGQEPGAFARPKGISLDSDGHVYVSDAAFCNVQVFDEEGKLLIWIGGPGGSPGQFQITEGVFVDAADRVFIVDQTNHRVQRFQYLPEKKAEATASAPGAPPAAPASPAPGAPAAAAR